jgi:hypothetical protein
MTAKEFHRKEHIEVNDDLFYRAKDLGLIKEVDCDFAERYHQAKLKLLGIGGVVGRSEQLSDFERWAKLNAKNMHDIDYWIAEYRYQKSLNFA